VFLSRPANESTQVYALRLDNEDNDWRPDGCRPAKNGANLEQLGEYLLRPHARAAEGRVLIDVSTLQKAQRMIADCEACCHPISEGRVGSRNDWIRASLRRRLHRAKLFVERAS
jgi:hypothetical protein